MTKTYTFDESIVSDLYKDVYGTRSMAQGWSLMTDDEKQVEWDYLCKALEREIADEQEREDYAVTRYKGQIEDMMALGATDREQAITWLVDSIKEYQFQSADEICYHMGLPYRMHTEFEAYIKAHPWKDPEKG